jgi:hypothetical protein
MIVTFTPIEGFTPTVAEYLEGAITKEEADAPLLPVYVQTETGERVQNGCEKVPRVQRCTHVPDANVIYFHTSDNPYGGYEELARKLNGATRAKILERAYGVPTKARLMRFPKFRDMVHVIPASKIPTEGTRYHFVDPCAGRNWFMHWFLVDSLGRIFLYREWPCAEIYIPGEGFPGVWAEPSGGGTGKNKEDGRRGPGQNGFGWGLARYKEEIERLEATAAATPMEGKGHPEAIMERWMDSRYGNAASTATAKECATTLIEECCDVGLYFQATPGDQIDEGVTLINNLFSFDDRQPLSVLNEPRLFISETCANTIFAVKTWTGADGRHGATKDPIDLLRYMAQVGITHIDAATMRGYGSRL